MKQHITEEQYEELSDESKLKITKWWNSKSLMINPYTNPDLFKEFSIGQMIEFLDEQNEYEHWWKELFYPDGKDIFPKYEGELCDALWSACKEVLEK